MTEWGLLDGKDEIMVFLNCTEHKLLKYASMGMPVLIGDGGRWLAHKDNIEAWFREITWPKKPTRKVHKTFVK